MSQQKIIPCLWFNMNAEEAIDFYSHVFKKHFRKLDTTHYTKDSPAPEGTVVTIEFELFGQRYVALNGGPQFPFTDAVSFQIMCDTQDEIDAYWTKLLAEGGKEEQCGWLRDKFGVPWQIVPTSLIAMHKDKDRERANRVMKAMMGMVKLDIAKLKEAYDGADVSKAA